MLLESLKEPGDVQAIDERMVYFDRYWHSPAAILLGILAEYNTGNRVLATIRRVRYRCETNPRKG